MLPSFASLPCPATVPSLSLLHLEGKLKVWPLLFQAPSSLFFSFHDWVFGLFASSQQPPSHILSHDLSQHPLITEELFFHDLLQLFRSPSLSFFRQPNFLLSCFRQSDALLYFFRQSDSLFSFFRKGNPFLFLFQSDFLSLSSASLIFSSLSLSYFSYSFLPCLACSARLSSFSSTSSILFSFSSLFLLLLPWTLCFPFRLHFLERPPHSLLVQL